MVQTFRIDINLTNDGDGDRTAVAPAGARPSSTNTALASGAAAGALAGGRRAFERRAFGAGLAESLANQPYVDPATPAFISDTLQNGSVEDILNLTRNPVTSNPIGQPPVGRLQRIRNFGSRGLNRIRGVSGSTIASNARRASSAIGNPINAGTGALGPALSRIILHPAVIIAIAGAVIAKLAIDGAFGPGGIYDTRLRFLVENQVLSLLDREQVRAIRTGDQIVRTTTLAGLRGGVNRTNSNLRGIRAGNPINIDTNEANHKGIV